MTSEPGDPRQALERERDRLDAILGRSYAWRALRRLEQREAEGRAGRPGEVAVWRTRIEAALAGNRVYQARQKLSEAITLLASPIAPVAVVAAPSPPVVVATTPPADDFTLIRGIDSALAARLAAIGVGSFAAIAGWRAADVHRISDALGLDRRIQRQNWIEQAALIVARRRPEAAAPPPAAIPPTAEPPKHPPFVPVAARPFADLVSVAVSNILAQLNLAQPNLVQDTQPAPPPSVVPEPVIAAPPATDDLTAIRGLDARSAAALAAEGITRYAAIARWSADDVARLRAALGSGATMIRAQWIEQAAMLAAGHLTRHARIRPQRSVIPLAPRPAATATARDEGVACELRCMQAEASARRHPDVASAPDPALFAPSLSPATSPAPDIAGTWAGTWDDEIALTRLVDFAAVSNAADPAASRPAPQSMPAPAAMPVARPAAPLAVVVLPPQPVVSVSSASIPLALTPHALPPLSLQLLPESSAPSTGGATLIDYDSDSLLDIAATTFAEADVRIVPAVASEIDGETDGDADVDPRPFAVGGGAGTLQSRLRKASDHGDEFDSRGYAAYRSSVEEASVEIVHRNPAARDRADAVSDPQSARESGGPTTVRRFLKALTGQER